LFEIREDKEQNKGNKNCSKEVKRFFEFTSKEVKK
jgi:hypothetical protein